MISNEKLRQQKRLDIEMWQIRQAHWIDMLGLIVPLAAPLVPAFLTATAIIAHYPALLHIEKGWIVAVAIVAGAVIEILGIISIETMFDMQRHNEHDDGERAPLNYARAAVGFYLLLVLMLVLLLKIWPHLALWSLVPLVILGFITSGVMVLRKQHNERVYRTEAVRVERSNVNEQIERLEQTVAEQNRTIAEHGRTIPNDTEREQSNTLERTPNMTEDDRTNTVKPNGKTERHKSLMSFYRTNPHASYDDAAEHIGCAKSTIANDIKALKRAGRVHRNGDGMEVL